MRYIWACMMLICCAFSAMAEDRPVTFKAVQSFVQPQGDGFFISLMFDRAVPWKVDLVSSPPQLVIDLKAPVNWGALAQFQYAGRVRTEPLPPEGGRMIIGLDGAMRLEQAQMNAADARLEIVLAAHPDAPLPPPEPADQAAKADTGRHRLVVVLDPGHGGVDAGAVRNGVKESALVLDFTYELQRVLVRDPAIKVVMTRRIDEFVPLQQRLSKAHEAGADVFLSFHADAAPQEGAEGLALYTLSAAASEKSAQLLAQRHDRDDLLAGVDLGQHDDQIAGVLMDLARHENDPRVQRLVQSLEISLRKAALPLHPRAHQEAGFSVLKAPDIPSVLIELGFLTSKNDLERLQDPIWRAKTVMALREGVKNWAAQDAFMSENMMGQNGE